PGQRRLGIWALGGDALLVGVDPLAAEAVVAAVLAEVDLARVPERLEDPLHDGLVPLLGGADEVVVADPQPLPRLAELGGDAVGIGPGLHARLGCGLGDLVAVLVGAGQDAHVVASQPVIAGHRVGDDRRVGVPQVGRRVPVVARGGEIEDAVGRAHFSSWALMCDRPSHVTWSIGTSASVPSGKPTMTLCFRTRSERILPLMQPPPPQLA